MTGNRTCDSRVDPDTGRSYCFGDSTARVEIFERPWHESILFPRGCICNSTNNSYLSLSFFLTLIHSRKLCHLLLALALSLSLSLLFYHVRKRDSCQTSLE